MSVENDPEVLPQNHHRPWGLFVLLSGWLSTCQTTPPPPLEQLLPGRWEVTFLEVDLSTFRNSDTSMVLRITAEDWGKKGSPPAYQYEFAAENQFRIFYPASAQGPASTEKGLWNTFGDTLLLIKPDATPQFKAQCRDQQLQLSGLIDWDGDGREDDAVFAIFQRRP